MHYFWDLFYFHTKKYHFVSNNVTRKVFLNNFYFILDKYPYRCYTK